MSDLGQIYTKLQEIDGKCNQLLEWKAVHSEHHKSLGRDIGEIRNCLFGENPGLVNRVQQLWSCKSNITTWKDMVFGILRITIAAGIISLIVWLLTIYKSS